MVKIREKRLLFRKYLYKKISVALKSGDFGVHSIDSL